MSAAPMDRALELVRRSLAVHGVRASTSALLQGCRGELTLASFARCAREFGLESEVVVLRRGDVEFLAAGTLLALADDTIVLLRAHRAGGYRYEQVNGETRWVRHGDLPEASKGLVLRSSAVDAGLLRRLWRQLQREPHGARALGWAIVLPLVVLGLSLAAPLLTRAALSTALVERADNTLRLLVVAGVVVGVQIAYVSWLRQRAHLYLTLKMSERASLDIFAYLLRLPFHRLRTLGVSQAQQAVASGAAAAESVNALVQQGFDVLLGAGYLVVAFYLDLWAGAIASVAGMLVILWGAVFGQRRTQGQRTFLTHSEEQQQALYEMISGIETIRSESVEGRMLTRWIERLVQEERAALTLRVQSANLGTVLGTTDRAVYVAVLLVVAWRSVQHGVPVADLIAALQVVAGVLACAQKCALLPMTWSDCRSNIERAEGALTGLEAPIPLVTQAPETQAAALAVRNLWFRYEEGGAWVLADFNLEVEAGQTVVLSWPSGAGKSTLLRVLAGLLTPTRGDVLVFGLDAPRARRLISYIPQTASLLPVSILENLRVLSANAPTERLIEAAEATGLAEIAATWGMGLSTVVSLGGANLSSGQRQLVLFTAAVAAESPIVLLDEALAHVDLSLRARLGVQNMFLGRTVIAVVHDATSNETVNVRVVEAPRPAELRA